MRNILFVLFCVFFCVSCEKHTFYYVDRVSNDTIASCLYCNGEYGSNLEFVIVVRDSIYKEEDINELLKNLDVIPKMKNVAKVHRKEKKLSPRFNVYLKQGYFSEFYVEYYDDMNFYLKGDFIYSDNGDYKINLHNDLPKMKLNSFQDLNKEESVNVLLRDSVMKVLGQQYRRLSFMDYQLGGPYLKKRKYIIGQTIQGEEIDGIDILHYDNTIYEIKVYFKDYENGFDTPELNKILDLYREKYGNNYGGNEWVFSNSSIKIETKLEEFTIGKNGELIRGKRRDMPQRNVITEIVITYYDNEVDSILKVKRQKDELIEKKKKEDEEKVRHQQLLDNI